MFDMHYDLLTLAYMAKDDVRYKGLFDKLHSMKGICANLYFMSKEEMDSELDYPQDIDVFQMFNEAKGILDSYNLNGDILYSIEGCDYIKDTLELERLKQAGLNSILLVWNNENKYGSGNRSDKGLTMEGRKFIRKAIDLGLGIDLSHANKQTFYDIIDEVKKAQTLGKKVICFASHSNLKSLCDVPRNLDTEQILALKEVSGYLGIVAYPGFLTDSDDISLVKEAYVKHILEAVSILSSDYVMLSSDNMDFINYFTDNNNSDKAIYEYDKMALEIREQLLKVLSLDDVNKIMYINAKMIYDELTS